LSKTNEMVLTSDSSRNSRRRPANSWPAAEPFNLFHYTQPGQIDRLIHLALFLLIFPVHGHSRSLAVLRIVDE
jgi:hypothetical protein